MKYLYLTALLFLTLSGCISGPGAQIRDNLWYAETEQPNWFRYHAYVLFQDTNHFIWWHTVDPQDVVMKRFDYYTHDNGTTDTPVTFTRTGDQLKGEARIPWHRKTGGILFTQIQSFTGHFDGDRLDMELIKSTAYPDGRVSTESPIRWSMKRLGTGPAN